MVIYEINKVLTIIWFVYQKKQLYGLCHHNILVEEKKASFKLSVLVLIILGTKHVLINK